MDNASIPPESIARHTVQGSAYSIGASAVTIVLGLARTYLMVLFLLPEDVGLAALALLIINLVNQLSSFGLRSAFIHNQENTETFRKTYYTLSVLVGITSLIITSIIAPIVSQFYPNYPNLTAVIWVYAGAMVLRVFNQPMSAFIEKDLAFKNIAVLDIFGAIVATIIGPGMAALGYGVWAIIGEFAGGAAGRFILLHFWLRPQRPKIGIERKSARWFWSFGKSIWVSSILTYFLDNFDDFWVGTSIGKSQLGLYRKAYDFSRYPRRVVATPILSVFFPTFAHLQGDRTKLSRAFFRATSLMVRFGALFSLLVILAAPEVFRLFLPDAWQPMRVTFQLMIIYTFFDPVSLGAGRLLVATGKPDIIARTRALQAIVFIPTVVIGAQLYGINGVAIAADLMVIIGALLLFRNTYRVVDYSARALWLWPIVAMVIISTVVIGLNSWFSSFPDFWVLLIKIIFIPTFFIAFLLLTELEQLQTGLKMIRGLIKRKPDQSINK